MLSSLSTLYLSSCSAGRQDTRRIRPMFRNADLNELWQSLSGYQVECPEGTLIIDLHILL